MWRNLRKQKFQYISGRSIREGIAFMLILRVGHATFCRGGNHQLLQQHGIRSEQAASGREALEFLRLYDYDMVLMDLHLPDVPAYEVVRMMRAASLKTPVVIMSDTA